MAGNRVGFWLAGNCIGRNRLAILSIVSFVQTTILDHSAGAVQLAGGHALAIQYPLTARGNLIGDPDLAMREELSDEQSRDLLHDILLLSHIISWWNGEVSNLHPVVFQTTAQTS